MKRMVVIGSGPGGWTAALYGARAGLAPEVYTGPLTGGLLKTTTEVENYPGFAQGIDGGRLVDEMALQAQRFGATVHDPAYVDELRPHAGGSGWVVRGWRGAETFEVESHAVVLATGSTPRALGVPGEKEYSGRGVSTCATCDGAFFRGRRVAVVGGGDSACEEALYLANLAQSVQLWVRGSAFRASEVMHRRVREHPNIVVRTSTRAQSLHGDGKKLTHAELVLDSGELSQEAVDAVFVAIGHVPNTQLVRSLLPLDEQGYVVPIGRSSTTAQPGLFAAGDVLDPSYRQAITAAASGCVAAMDVQRYLSDLSL